MKISGKLRFYRVNDDCFIGEFLISFEALIGKQVIGTGGFIVGEVKGAGLDTDTWRVPQLYVKLSDNAATELGFKKRFRSSTVCIPTRMILAAFHGGQAFGAPKQYQKEVTKNGISKTLPGLRNFYMVGQWAGGTIGLSTVTLMGRELIRDLCKQDNKQFLTTTPQ